MFSERFCVSRGNHNPIKLAKVRLNAIQNICYFEEYLQLVFSKTKFAYFVSFFIIFPNTKTILR